MLAVILIILFSGIVGGIAGALIREESESGKASETQRRIGYKSFWAMLGKRAFLGIVAAMVVPLFLTLAAPGTEQGLVFRVLGASTEDPQSISNVNVDRLIFAGFCILAAVSAQRFLLSMSERMVQDAKTAALMAEASAQEARQDAAAAHEEAADANARAEEAEETLELVRKNPEGVDQPLSEPSSSVLKAMLVSPAKYPSIEQIAKITPLDREAVEDAIGELGNKGFIKRYTGDQETPRWGIRSWGRHRLLQDNSLAQDELDIMKAIRDSSQRRPDDTSISAKTGLPMKVVTTKLPQLEKLGLVDESESEPGGWRLRSSGKKRLGTE